MEGMLNLMPLLFFTPESETRGRVNLIHSCPEMLTQLERSKGVLIDKEPTPPERKKGKAHVLYVNPLTADTWFEEIDVPLTQEEQLQEVNEQNLDLMAAITDIAIALDIV